MQLQIRDDHLVLVLDTATTLALADVAVTVWGERHSIRNGGLTWTLASDDVAAGTHPVVKLRTNSELHPLEFSIECQLTKQGVVFVADLSALGAAGGQDELLSLTLADWPSDAQLLAVRQVSVAGRLGARWATPSWARLDDPVAHTEWGLFASLATPGCEVVLLPLSGGGAVGRWRRVGVELELVTTAWYGRATYKQVPLGAIAIGSTPSEARAQALQLAANCGALSPVRRQHKVFPECFEWLGLDPGTSALTELDRVLANATQRHVPIRWVMLGADWLATDSTERLASFGTNTAHLPQGLRRCVERLAGTFGLRSVAAAVPAQGGWSGVTPELVQQYAAARFVTGADGRLVPHPSAAGETFYRAWFDELSNNGLDLIRVEDSGSLRSSYLARASVGTAAAALLSNLEQASAAAGLDLVLSGALDGALWSRLDRVNVLAVQEPGNADAESIKRGLVAAALLGTWLAPLAWPDAGAIDLAGPGAMAQMVLAALSGGPVAVRAIRDDSDAQHALRLALNDGRILPPAAPALVPDAYWHCDPLANAPLVLVSKPSALPRVVRVEAADEPLPPPSGVTVGVINATLAGADLVCILPLANFDLAPAETYAVNLHFADERYVLAAGEAVELTLGELQAELVTIVPLRAGRALIGLPHKLLGASGCHLGDDGYVSVPEPGPVLLYDDLGAVPHTVGGAPFEGITDPSELRPGTYWRSGPWTMACPETTLFTLPAASVDTASPATPSPEDQ